MKLYSYWRSSTSYRVRIALNLKGVAYEYHGINLREGEQLSGEFLQLNRSGAVPVLQLSDGRDLAQSMAILDYLEQTVPEPALLPTDPFHRARVLSAAQIVASDIHPVNNLKVLKKLEAAFGATAKDKVGWMNDWMAVGFDALMKVIDPDADYCFASGLSWADICLVPQLYNAQRWGMDLTNYTRLTEIAERCLTLPAFEQARPENQPDAH